ncbi:arylsulfatase [Candidatus Poribacteria bacterium]
MAKDRPNLVLICVDQWRGDCLGFTGHPVVETPHLDRLAKESTYFPRAYSATPTCVPARRSLLTGLSQRTHGMVGYADGMDWNIDTTLPGVLADAGYHTQCIGKMHVHPKRSLVGFYNILLHDGYLFNHNRARRENSHLKDDYLFWLHEKTGIGADFTDTGLGCNGYVARPWIYDEMLHPTSWVVTQAIDFLRRRDPSKPFFLKLSFVRPHPPLDPPQYYFDLYQQKELPPLPKGDWVTWDIHHREIISPVPTDQDQIDRARRAYYAQITHIDHQLNRFFHALVEYEFIDFYRSQDNTAILFCADHGEMLYDHNLIAKVSPYDGSVRIPFMVRFPGIWDIPRGNTIEDPVVELRDVLPTLCEIAEVDIPESVEGNSVVGLARGEEKDWRKYLHGEHFSGIGSNQWVTDGSEKYIWFPVTGEELLFDLKDDPKELHNLSQEKTERVAFWRERLARELEGREEGFVENGKLVKGAKIRPLLREAKYGYN